MAAAQLISGNHSVRYRKMGLHRMPYGPQEDGTVRVGSVELLGHSDILPHQGEWEHGYDSLNPISSDDMQMGHEDDPILEDVIRSVKDVQLIIMNPPYTKKANLAKKFSTIPRDKMLKFIDVLAGKVAKSDTDLGTAQHGQELLNVFIALAERCIHEKTGVLAMILPTSLMTQKASVGTRRFLAKRFQVHTIITSHAIGSQSMSSIRRDFSESILICHRQSGEKMPTRIISLDKMPTSELESANLHQSIGREAGLISDGWGEISYCDTGRIDSGDWADLVWRSPRLAEMSYNFANMQDWKTLFDYGMIPRATGYASGKGKWESTSPDTIGALPVLKSKGQYQTHIKAQPDEWWVPKRAESEDLYQQNEDSFDTEKTLQKSGYLLVSAGQGMDSGRLTAVASDEKYGGEGWHPITNTTVVQAKAAAVFLNSTLGRLQIMRERPQKLAFPRFTSSHVRSLRVPGLQDPHVVDILSDCWERTAEMEVPLYRHGECEVRRLWDEAVAKALRWDVDELEELRYLLHKEPFVRGKGYNEYK